MKLGPSCGVAVLQRPSGPSWSAFAAAVALAICSVTAAGSAASSAWEAGTVSARLAAANARRGRILLFIVFPWAKGRHCERSEAIQGLQCMLLWVASLRLQ